jgi:hypothetical protein
MRLKKSFHFLNHFFIRFNGQREREDREEREERKRERVSEGKRERERETSFFDKKAATKIE